MSVIRRCRLATNPRTGEPFSIVASDFEAESMERAGWPVVEYVPAEQHRGAMELLATIGQLANTNESLDETAMVRVPLRLLRAARTAGGGQ